MEIENDPSSAACVARRVHSRKSLEYQRRDQAAKSAEMSMGKYMAHIPPHPQPPVIADSTG